MKEEYVKENIPADVARDAILNIATRDVNPLTHGFHKYPAKFIPQIPRWAIEKYMRGKTNGLILDPFCGSGTTLVESMLSGNNAIGIDIDPLSALITKVKTTPVDAALLEKASAWIVASLHTAEAEFMPDCTTLDHWFAPDAIRKLSVLRTLIDAAAHRFGGERGMADVYELLLICFSSIIRRVSNADNESQKTYVSHTRAKVPEEVFATFISQLAYFKERIALFSAAAKDNGARAKVIVGSSAGDLDRIIGPHAPVDLVVTSPPYIKSVDYIYNQMAELFWIGDLFGMQTQTRQNEKKKMYVGNNRIAKTEYNNYSPHTAPLGIARLDENLRLIFDRDEKNGHKHAFVTYRYFVDMENHFRSLARLLAPGTHYVMVVGNSTVSDVVFDTAEYLIAIAAKNGFRTVNKWGYKIKNRYMRFNRQGRGGIIDIDWVMDFEMAG